MVYTGILEYFPKIINQLLIQLPIALVHKIINIPYLQFFITFGDLFYRKDIELI
ncbi:MAG: hypothetical protein CLLPBCKN_005191 [Chroococcidiopsis cubana SAG 39.79]|nr:hypothetical protein [Chroococcidiopsis cubana SAG 39.79]